MEDPNFKDRSNHIAKIITIKIFKNGNYFTTLKPEKRFYIDQNNQPHSEVALKSTLFEDFYVVLGDVDMDTGLATIQVKIRTFTPNFCLTNIFNVLCSPSINMCFVVLSIRFLGNSFTVYVIME